MVVAQLEPAAVVMRRISAVGTVMALAIAAHTVGNLGKLRKPNVQVPPVDERVSVLIPARNEQAGIAAAVQSALAQTGVPALEVIVLDDNSTDETSSIVRSIDDERLRLISSTQDPPVNWLGKPWACAQLADQASGSVLVFMDADVRLSPDAVRASVRAMRAHAFAMVSPYPRQLADNWLAVLTQPLVTWSWCALLPLRWSERSARPSLAAANGQFLVMDADTYRRVGGHGSVAAEVIEDVALMRAFKNAGATTCTMDGSAIASCEMYESPEQTIDGYAKSLWAAFGGPMASIGINALLFVAFVAPPIAAISARSKSARAVGAMGYMAGAASRALVARRMGTRIWPDSALHPASVAAFITINAISWRRHKQGLNHWKGRAV
ncbi:MAG: glycosyltransferase family 2 protein [Actinomycetota bacterium]|nr:glycosyltransferase family 2 protein [Actinomycetota bacterium]